MSNESWNAKEIAKFRKQLKKVFGDLGKIDRKVLEQSVNEGVRYAKKRTPVGKHPNPVTFTIKNGKHAGEIVSFNTTHKVKGGFLKKSWEKTPTRISNSSVACDLINSAEYASYWNDGHRIVTKAGGPTKGFVKGTHLLERSTEYIQKRLKKHFIEELEEVKKKHGA